MNDLLIDYDKHTVSYIINYILCSDRAQVFAYSNLVLGIRITPKFVQISNLDHISLLDDIKIYNANLEILNDFVNQKLPKKYTNTGKEDNTIESDPTEPFIQVSCILSLVKSLSSMGQD
ncbi:MAG: hypothetical protein WA941_07520 [Nitrososphaeraceae archaeon]